MRFRILSGGSPDDGEYEFENSLNCSLFALVVFVTADSAPDLASFCYGPTSSTSKLLQYFDKIQLSDFLFILFFSFMFTFTIFLLSLHVNL